MVFFLFFLFFSSWCMQTKGTEEQREKKINERRISRWNFVVDTRDAALQWSTWRDSFYDIKRLSSKLEGNFR